MEIKISKKRNVNFKNFIKITSASGNNLKKIDINFPLNNFISITGVSGGGKSSLIIETLYKAISKKINNTNLKPLPFKSLVGDHQIDKIIQIDQSPIGRTPRSNPQLIPAVLHLYGIGTQIYQNQGQEDINQEGFHSMSRGEGVKTVKVMD